MVPSRLERYSVTQEIDFSEKNNGGLDPCLAAFEDTNGVQYDSLGFDKKPFTIEALTDGLIGWKGGSPYPYKYVYDEECQCERNIYQDPETGEYLVPGIIAVINGDEENKIEIEVGDIFEISVKSGDIVELWAYCNSTVDYEGYYSGGIYSTNLINVYGNIMSMVDGLDFINHDYYNEKTVNVSTEWGEDPETGNWVITGVTEEELDYYKCDYMFGGYFSRENYGNRRARIKNASNLIIPLKSLGEMTFFHMFSGCEELIYPPKILATHVYGSLCCYEMFSGCKSMKHAPQLHIDGFIVTGNYEPGSMFYGMFKDCISLESPPRTVGFNGMFTNYIFENMFYGCTSLKYAPKILNTLTQTDYENSYNYPDFYTYGPLNNMFYDCQNIDCVEFNKIERLFDNNGNEVFPSYLASGMLEGCANNGIIICDGWNKTITVDGEETEALPGWLYDLVDGSGWRPIDKNTPEPQPDPEP